MKHRALGRSLVALPLMALAAMATGQSNEGVKQVERLIKASGNTVKAIADTKLQLRKTMDVYNALMADDAKDRRKLYGSLQKEMEKSSRAPKSRSGLLGTRTWSALPPNATAFPRCPGPCQAVPFCRVPV